MVFAVNTDGTGFTNLYSFTGGSGGSRPTAGLILSSNTLYGTTSDDCCGVGTVFAINTDGTGFTTLHNLTSPDGASPQARLILSGNTLYGTAKDGGSANAGTVFAVKTDGTGFRNLHSFSFVADGGSPRAGLILSGNTLYGTAELGGSSGRGTVFAINTDGTGFTNLYSFTQVSGSGTNSDGANPYGGLILSGNTLFGTAHNGGSSGNGTVFSLSLSVPQLTIMRSGENVVLRWATNAAGFTLQSTTNLVSTAVWATVSPEPVLVNGQNAVTNAISGSGKFYRLSQ